MAESAINTATSPVMAAARRRRSAQVRVGSVLVGGGAPIVVQSMTNTDTADVDATVGQVMELAQAGSELVRVTVNTPEAAAAVSTIRSRLDGEHCYVPLVGDFHYNGHRLLTEFPDCAVALAKYRINPGNVGFGKKKDTQFTTIIEKALEYERPVRIGVNWGSLDQALLTQLMNENAESSSPRESDEVVNEALVVSALQSAERAEEIGLSHNRIILSCKVSSVQALVAVYRDLAQRCDYALHLGLTEAGMGSKGIVASSAALGILLQEGIGDTIRISLTPRPKEPRATEVQVAQELLQTMGLRAFSPMVTACPGCGRTTSTYFQELTEEIQIFVRERMPGWRERFDGVENLSLAVMGCVVNGPGESKHADIGISLPGTGETPVAPVFVDGQKVATLRGESLADDFKKIIEDYVANTYPRKS